MKSIAYIRASNIYDDSRATKEIKALLELGLHIDVYGWNRSGCALEKCLQSFDSQLDNLSFFFYEVPIIDTQGNSIKKIVGWISWVYKGLIRKKGKYVAVHACDLDSGIGAFCYARQKKVKLVYDIYDYYIDCHHVPRIIEPILESFEIKIINNSEVTIICTEERKEQIIKAHPKNCIVVYNSPEVNEVKQGVSKYDFAYCGSLCSFRLLKEIFDLYPQNSSLKFAIAGVGEYSGIVENYSKEYEEFDYFGSVPYDTVLDIEQKSKAISAIYDPSLRNHRLCAPNKFYEAMALGKPLIVCKGTGIDKIVRNEGIGIAIDYDARQFYQALKKLVTDSELAAEMGEKARALYEQQYKWEKSKEILQNEYKVLVEKI